MKKILLIGNGKLGKALFSKLKKGGFDVAIFDKEDLNDSLNKDLSDFSKSADFVFICAPTMANEEIIKKIKNFSKEDVVFVSFSKGLSNDGNTATEIMRKVLNKTGFWAVVGGPMLSLDIDSGSGVVVSIGGSDEKTAFNTKEVFDQCGLETEIINEPDAVSFFGILKNIYAVGFGMADSLMIDKVIKDSLFKKAEEEMVILCKKNGFDTTLPHRPVGRGDLLVTGNAESSSNHSLGAEIIKNGKMKGCGESRSSFKFIEKKFLIDGETPFIKLVIDIMDGKLTSSHIEQFLRNFKSE